MFLSYGISVGQKNQKRYVRFLLEQEQEENMRLVISKGRNCVIGESSALLVSLLVLNAKFLSP